MPRDEHLLLARLQLGKASRDGGLPDDEVWLCAEVEMFIKRHYEIITPLNIWQLPWLLLPVEF